MPAEADQWDPQCHVGGHNWNVYKGTNGSNEVFSFLRTTDSTSGTVDVNAALHWIAHTKGWMSGSETIGDVQFGYEISSSPGGQTRQRGRGPLPR